MSNTAQVFYHTTIGVVILRYAKFQRCCKDIVLVEVKQDVLQDVELPKHVQQPLLFFNKPKNFQKLGLRDVKCPLKAPVPSLNSIICSRQFFFSSMEHAPKIDSKHRWSTRCISLESANECAFKTLKRVIYITTEIVTNFGVQLVKMTHTGTTTIKR